MKTVEMIRKVVEKDDEGNIERMGYLDCNDDKTGEWVEYDNEGIPFLVTNYKEGLKDGVMKWFDNGKLVKSQTYSKGKLEGVCKMYFDNGKLRYCMNYKNNKKEGTFYSYYKEGSIETIGTYVNNKEEGRRLEFDIEGTLKRVIYYTKGKKIGSKDSADVIEWAQTVSCSSFLEELDDKESVIVRGLENLREGGK